ncbi:ABC transporter ATP-binding protein [Cohnella abietis]|uniref:ABC transporter ATP-binding protein n=1 Tax=Cohnella abietis TaxID=2507935 RepID=A0A3T1D9X3_9BACL|nr:ABC transporter ATP-binding protein [Cohnella abietis]BBI34891.1 ABC transporter ATP-binding protein [Cohnella abietis]
MSNRGTVMSVRNLSKSYHTKDQHVTALSKVTFHLTKGEMLAVMGTSGSGKSTLLNILGTLDEPTSGDILLQGVKLEKMFIEPHATKFRRENIGFIFQSFQLLKDLSVEENIALPLVLKGLPNKEIRDKVNRMLELVGLMHHRTHRPVELSGGQQQRVAISRALITSPPIVLADEPTGNLDYNTSREILKVITDMKQAFDQSIVIVTHDPMVATYADRVIFFHDGNIVDEYVCKCQQDEDMDQILIKFRQLLER